MKKIAVIAWLAAASLAGAAQAQPVGNPATDVRLRVVDVGAGLCVVVTVPGGHSMLYDAGRGQPNCYNAAIALVPSGKLDLVVLSHSDVDHVRELPAILRDFEVGIIIHPGDPRGDVVDGIRLKIDEEARAGARVFNLARNPVTPGTSFPLGDAKATVVAGWSDGRQTQGPNEPNLNPSGRHNALSLVVRVEYRGHSVLLTGDTVGRPIDKKDTWCQYAERIMVARASTIPIRSEVLIGQHHGGDNSTSNCFIKAVQPSWVVFSAGHDYFHPQQSVADRLVSNGVNPLQILRTDRGDNEGGTGRTKEWITGALKGCRDWPGDDDIEVWLPRDPGTPAFAEYLVKRSVCGPRPKGAQ